MAKYNHFAYGQKLAKNLTSIDASQSYFEAVESEDIQELHERITRVKSTILVAVDGSNSDYSDSGADATTETPQFFFVIAAPTNSRNTQSISATQRRCKAIAEQIIIRMLADAVEYASGLESIDPNSFTVRGDGPIGDNFYGVILGFNLVAPLSRTIDPTMWKGSWE